MRVSERNAHWPVAEVGETPAKYLRHEPASRQEIDFSSAPLARFVRQRKHQRPR